MSEELSVFIRSLLDKARLNLDDAREREESARLQREQAEREYALWQQLAELIK